MRLKRISVTFGLLWLLYFLYAGFFALSTGLNFSLVLDLTDWRIFQKLLLLAGPAYLTYAWIQRRRLIGLDLLLVSMPLLAWWGAFHAFGNGKGAMNALIVEPEIVALMSGAYLLRLPLAGGRNDRSVTLIGVGLSGFLALCAILVACFIPPLPD